MSSRRRYEAVLIVGDRPWASADAVGAAERLRAGGIAVALVGTGSGCAGFDPVDGSGPVPLILTSTADGHCVIVDGSGTRIVARDPSGDDDEDDDTVVVSGAHNGAARWAARELWRYGIATADVVAVFTDGAGSAQPAAVAVAAGALDAVVADQLARRTVGEEPAVLPEPGWDVTVEGFDIDRLRVNGTLFALADGVVGASGAPLVDYPGLVRWAVAGGVYVGNGPETHLLTIPVAMHLPYETGDHPHFRRVLDLRTGLLSEEVATSKGLLSSVRFLSLARPGTVVFRARTPDASAAGPLLDPPAEDPALDAGVDGEVAWMRVAGNPGGVVAAAADEVRAGNGHHIIDRVVAYVPSPDDLPAPVAAVERAREASRAGFDRLLAEHRAGWASRWEDADIVVEGDDDLQQTVRFALFHLMASVPERGEAAVGARGLTGTSYRGHVFWDADTFTLPFLAATHPASARAMLEYRLRRLPVAREIAGELGRRGARFPWESAHTGRDVTPTSARDRTGRVVPIRTGLLEEHIVAEVAWAACYYTDWTGDDEFARGPGLDLLVDTARYWVSRVRREEDGAHIYGVIGPDEYHEPVDDNAFTNVMARWNLRRAADAVLTHDPSGPAAAEVAGWRQVADDLVDGFDPDTGVYEQFAGFHSLEPLIIAEVAPRRPITADLLLGADRVRGAQVIKQADVLMLHHLVPEAVAPGSLEPNLRFYEPRTAHGSSLSPGVHASLLARTRDYGRALEALRIASRIDFDDLTGTTSGGLHLATMGALWQALALGFAGLRPRDGVLTLDPRLPRSWAAFEIRCRFRGTPVRVRVDHDELLVEPGGPLALRVDGCVYQLDGRRLRLHRKDHLWEETT